MASPVTHLQERDEGGGGGGTMTNPYRELPEINIDFLRKEVSRNREKRRETNLLHFKEERRSIMIDKIEETRW